MTKASEAHDELSGLSWRELQRLVENATGLPYPPDEAPIEEHRRCFVAQVLLISYQDHDDPVDAVAAALVRFKQNPSYETLLPYIREALGDPDLE